MTSPCDIYTIDLDIVTQVIDSLASRNIHSPIINPYCIHQNKSDELALSEELPSEERSSRPDRFFFLLDLVVVRDLLGMELG